MSIHKKLMEKCWVCILHICIISNHQYQDYSKEFFDFGKVSEFYLGIPQQLKRDHTFQDHFGLDVTNISFQSPSRSLVYLGSRNSNNQDILIS